MGDIGKEIKPVRFEPIEAPAETPLDVPTPITVPEPEEVPV